MSDLASRLRAQAALVGNPHHVCDARPMSERQPEATLLREASGAIDDLTKLLQEWLGYTGLRTRAFDVMLNPDDDEYSSGRDLIRRTDAALARAGNSHSGQSS